MYVAVLFDECVGSDDVSLKIMDKMIIKHPKEMKNCAGMRNQVLGEEISATILKERLVVFKATCTIHCVRGVGFH